MKETLGWFRVAMMIPDSSMEYPRVAFELSCVEFRAAELDLNILLKSLNMV